MSRILVCGAALLAASACGDNFGHPDGGPAGDDGAIDAAPDGAIDAPSDAGIDAPSDAGIDAPPDGGTTIVYPPGALVRVTAAGQVGVLLEDFPASMRNRLASELAALPVDVGAGLLFGWQRWASGTWTVPAAMHAFANALVVLR